MNSSAIPNHCRGQAAAWYLERVARHPRLAMPAGLQRRLGSDLHAGLLDPRLTADRQKQALEVFFQFLEGADPKLSYIVSVWVQFRVEVIEPASRLSDWSWFYGQLDEIGQQWLTNRRTCRVPLTYDELGEFIDLVTLIGETLGRTVEPEFINV